MDQGDARDMCHTGGQEGEEMRLLYRMLKLDEHSNLNFIKTSPIYAGLSPYYAVSAHIGAIQCCSQGCRSASSAVNLSSGSRRRSPPMKSAMLGSKESKIELRLDVFGFKISTLCTYDATPWY